MPRAPSICEEKYRFARSYHIATSDYGRAAMVLEQFAGVLRKDRYEKLKRFVERARRAVERSRRQLEQHAAKHGC
jgi:hypothetical protein